MNWALVVHWLPEVSIAASVLMLFFSLRAARRKILVDNLPTSKTSGVFIGLVELKGIAEGDGFRSALAGVECVWYRYTVKERVSETETDSDGKTSTKTSWETVAEGKVDEAPFFLKDDRGEIRIHPAGADIEPQVILNRRCGPGDDLYDRAGVRERLHSDRVREFKEEAIRLHSRIFVVGQARQRHDKVAAEIAADKHAPMFLISTKSEDRVSGGLRWYFWGVGVAGLFFALLSVYLRHADLAPEAPHYLPAYLRAAGIFSIAWFLGWAVMLFNSLIDLRQRVSKAWANIDVELKRRADLLPNLEKIVHALAEHEKMAQPMIAALRSQASVSAPGRPGPDPVALGKPVRLLAEAYPPLKADAAYGKLQKELGETEDRIALARGYFNDIVTFHNTRISSFPDGLFAGLIGMRERKLMDAAGFSGPCPKCRANVYKRRGLRFCPFCSREAMKEGQAEMPAQCSAFMKPFSATDDRLGGRVVCCGSCGFRLPVAT